MGIGIGKHFWTKDLKEQITQRVKACAQCKPSKQGQNTWIGYQASEIPQAPV